MSLFGPVTDTDRRRWQHRTARWLLELLDLGQRQGLPPIDWTVTDTAVLIGRCTGFPAADRRDAWQAWTGALSAEPVPERDGPDGIVYLESVVRDQQHPALTRLAVTATWEPDDTIDRYLDDLPDHDRTDHDQNDAVSPSGGRA